MRGCYIIMSDVGQHRWGRTASPIPGADGARRRSTTTCIRKVDLRSKVGLDGARPAECAGCPPRRLPRSATAPRRSTRTWPSMTMAGAEIATFAARLKSDHDPVIAGEKLPQGAGERACSKSCPRWASRPGQSYSGAQSLPGDRDVDPRCRSRLCFHKHLVAGSKALSFRRDRGRDGRRWHALAFGDAPFCRNAKLDVDEAFLPVPRPRGRAPFAYTPQSVSLQSFQHLRCGLQQVRISTGPSAEDYER